MKVFEKIRIMRELKKWSQENMAEQLQMSVNGYSKIERGETQLTVARLQQIAGILGVDPMDFVNENEHGVFLVVGENSTYGNVSLFNSNTTSTELTMEVEHLKLKLQYTESLLQQKEKEIANLQEIISLLKAER